MQDLIVVVVVIGFFGLCVALVAGCSRILGPAEVDTHDHEALDPGSGSHDAHRAAV